MNDVFYSTKLYKGTQMVVFSVKKLTGICNCTQEMQVYIYIVEKYM